MDIHFHYHSFLFKIPFLFLQPLPLLFLCPLYLFLCPLLSFFIFHSLLSIPYIHTDNQWHFQQSLVLLLEYLIYLGIIKLVYLLEYSNMACATARLSNLVGTSKGSLGRLYERSNHIHILTSLYYLPEEKFLRAWIHIFRGSIWKPISSFKK